MLLRCFSAHQSGLALLKASFLRHWRVPASGETGSALEMVWHLLIVCFCQLEHGIAAGQRRTEGKKLIFLSISISLTMIPVGKKSSSQSRLISFCYKSGFAVQGRLFPVDKLPPWPGPEHRAVASPLILVDSSRLFSQRLGSKVHRRMWRKLLISSHSLTILSVAFPPPHH